jgi:hypothetical protein
MLNHAHTSGICVLPDNSVLIRVGSSRKFSAAVLLLSLLPSAVTGAGATLAYVHGVFLVSAVFTAISLPFFAFFLLTSLVFLQSYQSIHIRSQSITFSCYQQMSIRKQICPASEVAELTAMIDRGENVMLCLRLKDDSERPLVSLQIEELDQHCRKLAEILKTSYVASIGCCRIISPPPLPEQAKPDKICIDITKRVIKLLMPDQSMKMLPFTEIASIYAMGQREGDLQLSFDDACSIEHICEPLMCMTDGTLYFLQRFTSMEPVATPRSHAYVCASKTADYLRHCVS